MKEYHLKKWIDCLVISEETTIFALFPKLNDYEKE